MSEGRRIVLALVLSVAVIFTWQKFFAPPAPEVVPTEVKTDGGSIEPTKNTTVNTNENSGPIEPKEVVPSDNVQIEDYVLTNGAAKYTINSFLRVKGAESTHEKFLYKDIIGGEVDPRILFKVGGSDFRELPFSKVSSLNGELLLENKETGIAASYHVDEKGFLKVNFSSAENFELKFFINSTEMTADNREARSFVILKKALVKETVGKDSDRESGAVKWFGLDYHYHLFAIIFPEKKPMTYKSYEKGIFEASTTGLFTGETNYEIDLSYIFTLKNYDKLAKFGDNLDLAVDFGIWSILAVPMLKALKFFYEFLKNWGLAIILLTICMRLLTFPLQYKSFKSMKRMQVIQPKIKEINERYKDDAQKKQLETMSLFKKEGVNPLGGCLPMLLQFPIFLAFYRMLGAAVELVGAPFYFWITDLSTKDPYYVLPVLVTIVMFLQQKLTPTTTTDPMQQKVMMFMPLIFGFILKDLPSGLNLYIFVSTGIGILMQKVVFAKMGEAKKA